MTVGTKQLKNQLSAFLRRARAGEIVKITDRGHVVAELRGVGADPSSEAELLLKLEAIGLVTAGSRRFRDFRPVRLRRGASASKAIAEDRG